MSSPRERNAKFVIGPVAVAGSLVLLYFSAAPNLSCSRPSGASAECVVTAHALWSVKVAEDPVPDVEGAEMVASATGRSRTPPRLMFVSGGTRRDLGYFSQLFAGDWQAIDEFARTPSAPELRRRKPVTVRTLAAHLGALFLAVVGLGTIYSACRRY